MVRLFSRLAAQPDEAPFASDRYLQLRDARGAQRKQPGMKVVQLGCAAGRVHIQVVSLPRIDVVMSFRCWLVVVNASGVAGIHVNSNNELGVVTPIYSVFVHSSNGQD